MVYITFYKIHDEEKKLLQEKENDDECITIDFDKVLHGLHKLYGMFTIIDYYATMRKDKIIVLVKDDFGCHETHYVLVTNEYFDMLDNKSFDKKDYINEKYIFVIYESE